jgi:molybdopterin/thiamine biosynthesis adenylyltransferase
MFDGENVRPVLIKGLLDTQRTLNYQLVLAEPTKPRVDPEYSRLEESSVAVVGCGSVGSKVAAHLARAGFRKFVLVDGDMLDSGNLVRNELDWRAVGLHKAPALAARLKEIRAGREVVTHSIIMAGQESGGALAAAMASIQSCDVIVEATADAKVFNLCAAISRRSRKPMCWAQVFGGGTGGVVARVRPDLDLPPHKARQRIDTYYAEQGVPWPDNGTDEPYSTSGDGPPLIADDADVSVIAAHLARMVIDLAARPGATIFPYSAYVIGLRDAWLFEAPFDTRPIDLSGSDAWGTEHESDAKEALHQLIEDLLKKKPEDEG